MSSETLDIWQFINFGKVAFLYYYQGNFYHPLTLEGCNVGRLRRLCRVFEKENAALVQSDRSHPDYKTRWELATEQWAHLDENPS